jgi:hypothetical protein
MLVLMLVLLVVLVGLENMEEEAVVLVHPVEHLAVAVAVRLHST